MGFVLGLILAIALPILALGAIRELDLYQTGQFKSILYSLGWGAFAYGLASLINLSIKSFYLSDDTNIDLYFAPILEELLKGMILLIMVRRYQLTYSFDGALYGFAAGIGFAIFENFGYMGKDMSIAAGTAAQRVISANLVHASSSAILGIVLGMLHLRRISFRWLALGAGLSLAIGQHMVYNQASLGKEPLPGAISIGILGVVFVYFAIQLGKKQAQKWIKQKLGIDDGVTQSEIAVVDHLASSADILLPIVERFGAEKASLVEKLLYLEARLGLKRKAMDNFQKNHSVPKSLEAEILALRKEIKATHRAIGAYTMLFVRGLFTAEMVTVWDQMQAKIRERSALNGRQKGGGLWSSLAERLNAPNDLERHK
jgi:RsiW-degrading membrane proteinase PrsW (M82 family)